ncbi:hypothetical protein [Agromyces sp. Marseille-P2726]|uniref:hypothetical protein n=1 Tax=Agromyces sp. Marseille-P2726 TaxID=2709132 RepID=UPI00156F9A36|nr:hypothetical protein [Agromyces sp. Marseille-P2726]
MLQAWITIDGRAHFLPPELDTEAIMKAITDQLRAGGGFVELVRTPERVWNVLVSPGMSLSIEVTQEEDPVPGTVADSQQAPPAQTYLDDLDVF